MTPAEPNSRTAAGARRSLPGRVDGVDAARGIALIGMFVAHLAPGDVPVDAAELIALADERPRLLFALTAGIGLGLLTGATRPAAEPGARWVLRRQIAIRALLLIALGLIVVAVFAPLVFVILDVYGVAFLLMLPLLFLPGRVAVALGAVLLTMTPAIASLAERDPQLVALGDEPYGLLAEWFLVGAYPVIIWVPVMLLGLGLARLDIGSPRVIAGAALAGAVAASVALPLSRALTGPSDLIPGPDLPGWQAPVRASLETIGNTAVCILIVSAAVALTALARPAVRRAVGAVLSPVVAMGSMPLTVYTAHLVIISLAKYRSDSGVITDDSWPLLVWLTIGSMAFAWLWRRFVGRGPLEQAFRLASGRERPGREPGTDAGSDRVDDRAP
ncbi:MULTISPECIES: heparan-alpha-glucosaminide N-acetyltransferase domain-containing protein [unclassified Agromyces]|uniref:heparan-alpha-glucosaminide N-acetyltransferase domain-containing protein n=1 Tax=unclassified Agromyces TaxID=2639701 RepID=UPI0030145CBE